jgi:hypothetical protein
MRRLPGRHTILESERVDTRGGKVAVFVVERALSGSNG